jgi:hypothetical protein
LSREAELESDLDPPWLHLLKPFDRNWREKEIAKGRNPDPYIEQQLREAGVWPEKKGSVH